MPSQPTLDQFRKWITSHLDTAAEKTGKEIHGVISHLNAAGAYRSGRAILVIFEKVDEGLDRGADTALGELKRTRRLFKLDPDKLREVTEVQLREFLSKLKKLSKHEEMRMWGAPRIVSERLAKLDERLNFLLENFDVGFIDPAEPEMPPTMGNHITIETMTGGAIQQGTSHSQIQQFGIDVSAAKDALKAFEIAFASETLTTEQRSHLDADVATIKAQLKKPSISKVILTETMRSLRSLVEGITAGALTPSAVNAASALWTALT